MDFCILCDFEMIRDNNNVKSSTIVKHFVVFCWFWDKFETTKMWQNSMIFQNFPFFLSFLCFWEDKKMSKFRILLFKNPQFSKNFSDNSTLKKFRKFSIFVWFWDNWKFKNSNNFDDFFNNLRHKNIKNVKNFAKFFSFFGGNKNKFFCHFYM